MEPFNSYQILALTSTSDRLSQKAEHTSANLSLKMKTLSQELRRLAEQGHYSSNEMVAVFAKLKEVESDNSPSLISFLRLFPSGQSSSTRGKIRLSEEQKADLRRVATHLRKKSNEELATRIDQLSDHPDIDELYSVLKACKEFSYENDWFWDCQLHTFDKEYLELSMGSLFPVKLAASQRGAKAFTFDEICREFGLEDEETELLKEFFRYEKTRGKDAHSFWGPFVSQSQARLDLREFFRYEKSRGKDAEGLFVSHPQGRLNRIYDALCYFFPDMNLPRGFFVALIGYADRATALRVLPTIGGSPYAQGLYLKHLIQSKNLDEVIELARIRGRNSPEVSQMIGERVLDLNPDILFQDSSTVSPEKIQSWQRLQDYALKALVHLATDIEVPTSGLVIERDETGEFKGIEGEENALRDFVAAVLRKKDEILVTFKKKLSKADPDRVFKKLFSNMSDGTFFDKNRTHHQAEEIRAFLAKTPIIQEYRQLRFSQNVYPSDSLSFFPQEMGLFVGLETFAILSKGINDSVLPQKQLPKWLKSFPILEKLDWTMTRPLTSKEEETVRFLEGNGCDCHIQYETNE